jgi:hypothetical protein
MALQHAELGRAFALRRLAAAAMAERVIANLNPGATGTPKMGAMKVPTPLGPGNVYPTVQRSWWASWGRTALAAAAGFALAILVTRPWSKAPGHPVAQNPTTSQSTTRIAPVDPPAVRPVAQLALSTGAVFVCPSNSDDWRALESGGAVAAGMRVRTGPKVACEFKMADGSEVRLNADTQVTLASTRRVDVAAGRVYSSVRKAPEAFVVSAAPAGATLTALGTAFDVSCSAKDARLTVLEGSVKVESTSGQDVVRGGEQLTVADGRVGAKTPVENLMQATQWVDEILVLKGRDNPELAKRIDDIFAQLGHEKMWYMHAQEVRRLGDHCVVPLTRYIQSDRSKTPDDQNKRREAARIVGDVATSWAIPELINLLADDDGDVRYSAAKALQRLTGQSLGRRPEEWRDQTWMACTPSIDQWHGWWNQNKTRFPGADPDAVKPVQVAKKAQDAKTKG